MFMASLTRYCFCVHCRAAMAIGDWSNVETRKPRTHVFMGLEWISRKERAKDMMGEIKEFSYEPTPRWHPMRWMGWSVRRWIECTPWDGCWWEYARPKTAARNVLEERYGRGT